MADLRLPDRGAAPEPALVCALCGGTLVRIHDSWPGYMEPMRFTILKCNTCLSHQAFPRIVDSSIYDSIYRVSNRITGYARYESYVRLVKRHPDRALDLLSKREDIYWGIRSALAQCHLNQGARALDVGSGLGYLTFALRMAGLAASGVDMSREAVRRAVDSFGPHYYMSSLQEISLRERHKFDVVILAEVLEHMEDPVLMLLAAKRCLRPEGSIVITTPNRSFYPELAIWQTELPPVHLWWFSEKSLVAVANKLELRVTFTDFTRLSESRPPPISPRGDRLILPPRAFLDSHGNLIVSEPALNRLLRAMSEFDLYLALHDRLRRFAISSHADPQQNVLSGRRPTQCVTFASRE
ncbi:MAG TPA: methyltransferase domain-containing protein [Thermoplasmata archaeon]